VIFNKTIVNEYARTETLKTSKKIEDWGEEVVIIRHLVKNKKGNPFRIPSFEFSKFTI
jgi:hypothetical protein